MIFDFTDSTRQLTLDVYRDSHWLSMTVYLKGTRHQLAIVNLKIEGESVFIADIYIDDAQDRSQGLGSRLLKLVIAVSKRKGMKSIYGFASAGGSRVYSFYERLGFIVTPKTGKVELII